MILRLKKNVRKQAKRLHKETEKLYKKLSDKGSKGSSAKFDTNDVLLKMDGIENELKELRNVINQEKEQAYLEKMGDITRLKAKTTLK